MSEIKNKQLLLDKRYMRMALIWAENSYCKRRQVGAILVKDKMIISDGYNGTPSGFENICEERSNNSSEGATLYVTSSPCIECAKLIIQSGIERVVYADSYRLSEGIELLMRANIEIVSVELESE